VTGTQRRALTWWTKELLIALLSLPVVLSSAFVKEPRSGAPTFLVFKYQHAVGQETDRCRRSTSGTSCHAHFQLNFTGSSIALESDIRTGPSFEPMEFAAHGRNSTRSYVDLSVRIKDRRATIEENGLTRTAAVPHHAFALQQDAPFIAQELLLAYWRSHDRPDRIDLLPAGVVTIRPRGSNTLPESHDRLTRYTVHGVTWGDETVWLDSREQLAAVVGADAEEDRIEVVRPRYALALKEFAKQAAADAVADMEDAGRSLHPLATGTFALTHGTVINPAIDTAPLKDITVLVRDGRIAAVGNAVNLLPDTPVLDARGMYILPGLWDTHAHFEQWDWGPAYLAAGITSVRDMGNEIEFLGPIRNSLNRFSSPGPTMYAAGLIDSDPGSLTSEHAEDADAVRTIVRRYHELGYEEMKIYQSLRPDLIPVVTAEAHRLGMQVTGHVPTGTDALSAIRNGMDQITHVGFVTRVMRSQGDNSLLADSATVRTAIQQLLERHTVVEPTLARSEFNSHPRRVPFKEIEPTVAWLPPELAVILNQAGVPSDRETQAASSFQAALETTRLLHQAGVPLLVGSDLVVPGASVHRELELLVRAGLTPIEALRAATTVPARVLNVTDVGAVYVGQRADMVILDGDPLTDISNVRRVHWTVSRGRVYEPAPLWRLVDVQR
jgi:imidazolonepropionase-like amidohydrolase